MSFRVAYAEREPLPSKATKPVKRKNYLSFVHELPCIVTGRTPVQAAHLSTANIDYGHLGRGKGRKAADRWILPLCFEEHARQHAGNEVEYWRSVGLNPYLIALVLFGLWSDLGDDAAPFAKIFMASLKPTTPLWRLNTERKEK